LLLASPQGNEAHPGLIVCKPTPAKCLELKEKPFRQLERFTKRFEDFDLRLRSIHGLDLESL
jgi:hypothetical protein